MVATAPTNSAYSTEWRASAAHGEDELQSHLCDGTRHLSCKSALHMIVVVAAHPDDEVIGLGAQLPRLSDAFFVHITDGAPRNMEDAHRYGFATREEYARQRQLEFKRAMKEAGIQPTQCINLGVPDQEATANLTETLD